MRYVIIGNSAAGIGAAEAIRKIDADGDITIVADEGRHTYSRPLISYLLCGKTTPERMRYRGGDFYRAHNINFLPGKTVTAIDPAAKTAALDDGGSIPYDKLLVATGSSAFVPPFDGLDTVRSAHTFMSLDDAEGLAAALDGFGGKARALIVGAGLIGLKCAEGILERSGHITVIDLAPRVLPNVLDAEGAAMVQRHLEGFGVSFKLSGGVKRFEGDSATLDDGERLYFDVLVLAVGVRPNVSLLKGIADIDKGVLIDENARTTAADIYAAGDCAQAMDVSAGQRKIMALLPNAYMQGEAAGTHMAGGAKPFDKAMPMNAAGFFGLHVITAGSYTGDAYAEDGEGRYKRLFYEDNRLKGYILIGDTAKAGVYTSLIRERTPLDSIDFGLICERPGLMAFTRRDRASKLGGVQ